MEPSSTVQDLNEGTCDNPFGGCNLCNHALRMGVLAKIEAQRNQVRHKVWQLSTTHASMKHKPCEALHPTQTLWTFDELENGHSW